MDVSRTPLVDAVRLNTQVMFTNARIMLLTCDMDAVLCDMPIWKHAYHMLHSCDQWYINPHSYTEPDFHTPGLNSLDMPGGTPLTRQQLLDYLEAVRIKLMTWLDGLTDADLSAAEAGCSYNRLCMIMSQMRHFYAHLGNINATTIMATGQWPRVVGLTGKSGKSADGLYE